MAGRGARFGEEYKLPKPLLDVDGKPMVIRAFECMPKTDCQIFVVREEHNEKFQADKIINRHVPNAHILCIDYVTEGHACTCELAIKYLNPEEPVIITACDHGLVYDQDKLAELMSDSSIDVLVWTFTGHPTTRENPTHWAWLRTEQTQVKEVYCKYLPAHMNSSTTPVIVGTFYYRKAKFFLDGLKDIQEKNIKTNNEYYVDNVLTSNINNGLTVRTFEVDKYICWGLPKDYEEYRKIS